MLTGDANAHVKGVRMLAQIADQRTKLDRFGARAEDNQKSRHASSALLARAASV